MSGKSLAVLIFLLVALVGVFPQSNPKHIVAIDCFGPLAAVAYNINSALNGFYDENSFLLAGYQLILDGDGAYSCQLGLGHEASFGLEPNFVDFGVYVGQEYRFFPFHGAPRGFFIGPTFQAIFDFRALASDGNRGFSRFYGGLGATVGYQFVFEKFVLSLMTGYTAGALYLDNSGFEFSSMGLPKAVELFVGYFF